MITSLYTADVKLNATDKDYKKYIIIQNEYNKMQEINIPKKVITEDWESSVCPNCKENFSEYEECDDGYYQRAYSLERCPYCGQKLKWE